MLGKNDLEMLESARARSWPRTDAVRPDCPPALVDVISRATEPNRADRYATMSELSGALEAVISAQGWTPSAPRLGAIASEVTEPKPTSPTGFDSPTDTDLNTQAAARAAAVTAEHHSSVPPWMRQTTPGVPGPAAAAAPPPSRGLMPIVLVVLGAGLLAFGGALWWMNRRAPAPVVIVPDVVMPEPGPPPSVTVKDGG